MININKKYLETVIIEKKIILPLPPPGSRSHHSHVGHNNLAIIDDGADSKKGRITEIISKVVMAGASMSRPLPL